MFLCKLEEIYTHKLGLQNMLVSAEKYPIVYYSSSFNILPTFDSFRNSRICLTVQTGWFCKTVVVWKIFHLKYCVAGHSAMTWWLDSSSSRHSLQEWGSLILFCMFLCLFSLLCPVRNCIIRLRFSLFSPNSFLLLIWSGFWNHILICLACW